MMGRQRLRGSWLRLLGSLFIAWFWSNAGRGNVAHGAETTRGAAAGEAACLAWDAGTSQECPPVAEIEAAIGAMLGRPLASHGTCDTRVRGSFRPNSDGGWRVDIHFASRTGESIGDRSLEIRDAPCAALKDPLSLVVVLTLEGSGPGNTAFRLPNPPSARRDAAASGSMTTLAIGGAVSSGLVPKVGFGATLGLASRIVGGLSFQLETTVWLPSATSTSGPGGELWAWLGGAGVCPSLLRTRRFAAAACVRVLAGMLRGTGLALDEHETATRPFAAGELSTALLARLSRQISIYVSVGLAAPWVRPRFVYSGPDQESVLVHQPSVLIPMAGLGIELGSDDARPEGARP